jgi:NADPH-dependent curcumin reductase CurA
MRDVKSYIPPVKLNNVMRAGGIGRVIDSKSDSYKKGQLLSGTLIMP